MEQINDLCVVAPACASLCMRALLHIYVFADEVLRAGRQMMRTRGEDEEGEEACQ